MSELKWGDVTSDIPIEQLNPASTETAASLPSASASSPNVPSLSPSSTPAPVLPAPGAAEAAPAAAAASSSASEAASSSSADAVLAASLQSSLPSPAAGGAQDAKDEDDPLPIATYSGLNPGDATAQVEVRIAGEQVEVRMAGGEGAAGGAAAEADTAAAASSSSASAIYRAGESFEQLGLSKELLAAVYDNKWSAPSKIQAQALPVILSQQHPNLIGQAHHGSGKCFAAGTELRLYDGSVRVVEAIRGGEQLMGDDSEPRTVCLGSVVHGRSVLWRLSPTVPVSFCGLSVNSAHILVLVCAAAPWLEREAAAAAEGAGQADWCVRWWAVERRVLCRLQRERFPTLSAASARVRALRACWLPAEWEVSLVTFLSLPAALRQHWRMRGSGPLTFSWKQASRLSSLGPELPLPSPALSRLAAAYYLGLLLMEGEGGAGQGKRHAPLAEVTSRRRQCEADWRQRQRQSASGGEGEEASAGLSLRARLQLQYGSRLQLTAVLRHLLCEAVEVRRAVLAAVMDVRAAGRGAAAGGRKGSGCCSSASASSPSLSLSLSASLSPLFSASLSFHSRLQAESVQLLALSLGLRASPVRQRQRQGEGESGEQETTAACAASAAYRLSLGGCLCLLLAACARSDLRACIPGACRCLSAAAASASSGSACWSPLASSFPFSVERLGQADYHGFTVQGGANHRFITRDFTVTHNVSLHTAKPAPAPARLSSGSRPSAACCASVSAVSDCELLHPGAGEGGRAAGRHSVSGLGADARAGAADELGAEEAGQAHRLSVRHRQHGRH